MRVTEDMLHVAAYMILSDSVFGLPPSSFIRWRKALKEKPYRKAYGIFVALGYEVRGLGEFEIPGRAVLEKKLKLLQEAQRRVKLSVWARGFK